MAMEVMTKAELIDALTMLVEGGNSHWANKEDAVSGDAVRQIVSESISDEQITRIIQGMGLMSDGDVGGLTDDEMDALLGAI